MDERDFKHDEWTDFDIHDVLHIKRVAMEVASDYLKNEPKKDINTLVEYAGQVEDFLLGVDKKDK